MTIKKLLLFDIDGTLMTSKGATRASNSLAIKDAFGVDVDVSKHPFGGKTDWQILGEVLEPFGISRAEIGARMYLYEKAFARHLAHVIKDFDVISLPGALEVVAAMVARDDMLVGLVTGNTSLTAPVKLAAAGFNPEDFIVGAFGNESDDRNDLPRLALERAITLTKQDILPVDVLIIGDTTKDIECARAIGAKVVTVFTGFEERENIINAHPDYMLDDLTQFLTHVPLG